ncbi:MAG: AraC family transcriptional regulator, partial [Bacteroidales bacterium]|nr:AraC family transcriptional regulator [Bacteroidales bacterium]
IHEYTLNAIKEKLRYSEKSIKEICSEMDFPDASFFGKFFKQHTGITPLQYRKQVLQQEEIKNNE